MEPSSVMIEFKGALYILILGCQAVMSDLTCKPLDSESLVNETTFFNCSSSITAKEIHWYHYPVGFEALQRSSVYAFGKFYEPYEKDFVLEKNSSYGAYNLVIKSVKPDHAGRYECQDNGGLGNSCSAQLIVLDDEPECKSDITPLEVIGPNACGIQPDDLHLSCGISYHGNIAPVLIWNTLGKNDSIEENVTKEELQGRFTYNVTIKADQIKDKASYECQITKSRSSKHNCTLQAVELLYMFNTSPVSEKSIGKVETCSANTSSQSCQYKWKWFNKDDSSTVSNNQQLTVNKTGLYLCEATCNMRNIQCTVNASFVNATEGSEITTGDSSSSSISVVLGVLLFLLVVIIIVVVLILLWICRRRNSKQNKAVVMTVEGGVNYAVEESVTLIEPLLPENYKLTDGKPQVEDKDIPGATESNPIVIPDNDATEAPDSENPEKRKKTEEPRNEGFYYNLPVLLHIESLSSASNERISVSGLTTLDKELFIAFEKKSGVKVFQAIALNALRSIAVMGLDNPLDMVSSPVDRSLYISSSKEVFKIDRSGMVISKWPIDDGGGTLSVTHEQTVILSDWKRAVLREYSPDGKLICDVRLPSYVHPFHAVKTGIGQFVVSYERGIVHGVGKFDMNGAIIQSFSGMLKFPKYLAVNSDGCTFVTDQKNSRVLMLSPTLDPSKAILLDNDKFGRPSRICLDEENSRMFVADNEADNPRFIVFKHQNYRSGSNQGIAVNQDRPLGSNHNLKDDPGEIVEVISDNVSGNEEEEDEEEDEFLDAEGPVDESRGEKRKR